MSNDYFIIFLNLCVKTLNDIYYKTEGISNLSNPKVINNQESMCIVILIHVGQSILHSY